MKKLFLIFILFLVFSKVQPQDGKIPLVIKYELETIKSFGDTSFVRINRYYSGKLIENQTVLLKPEMVKKSVYIKIPIIWKALKVPFIKKRTYNVKIIRHGQMIEFADKTDGFYTIKDFHYGEFKQKSFFDNNNQQMSKEEYCKLVDCRYYVYFSKGPEFPFIISFDGRTYSIR